MASNSNQSDCAGECSWLFSELGSDGREKLRKMIRQFQYPKGEVIFQEGEPAFGFYIICKGKVKLAKHSLKGKKQILKLLGTGEVFFFNDTATTEIYTA